MKADDAQAPAQEWRVWSTLRCRVPVDAVAGGVVCAAQGGLHIADSWFAPKRLRSGFTDFHRWFRLGTNGYNDPATWQGFLTRHPNVAEGIAAL